MMGQVAHGDVSGGAGLCGEKKDDPAKRRKEHPGAALKYLISTSSPVYAVVC